MMQALAAKTRMTTVGAGAADRGCAARARASAGPDLTHVASRARIAGGTLENNKANLMAWIIKAQSLKPGSHMPDLVQFDSEQLHALAAYLQTLR